MTTVLVLMWTLLVVYSCILWWMHQRMSHFEDLISSLLKFMTSVGKVAEEVSKAVKEQENAQEQDTETE